MILLNVIGFERYGILVLSDDKKNIYKLAFQFFNDFKIQKGDKIYLNEKYLDKNWENFAQPYAFSYTNEDLLKKDKNFSEIDFITLYIAKTKKEILLKRIYG